MAMTAQEKREARAAKRAAEAAAAKAADQPTATEALNAASMQRPDSVRDAHGEIAKPKKSGTTVTVACKLGVAYLDIQLCQIVDKREMSSQGAKDVKEAIRIGNVVRLRGTSFPRGTLPEGFPEKPLIVAGAAMNPGIDKEWFDEWLRQNKLNPLVQNGMIFAHENLDHVTGQAREQIENQSGLEPVDPKKKDPRVPKPSRSEVSEIETGARTAAG